MMPAGGKLLIVIGLAIGGLGGVLSLAGRIPWLGHLPGDISVRRENFSFHFPITTSILISLVLSLLYWLFRR